VHILASIATQPPETASIPIFNPILPFFLACSEEEDASLVQLQQALAQAMSRKARRADLRARDAALRVRDRVASLVASARTDAENGASAAARTATACMEAARGLLDAKAAEMKRVHEEYLGHMEVLWQEVLGANEGVQDAEKVRVSFSLSLLMLFFVHHPSSVYIKAFL
jgi:hypothetical protein